MYNYYTDLKIKAKLREDEKEKERLKLRKKNHEKKMIEYTKNYENRIKNFIYNMAEKPIQIRENPKQYLTTREEFLTEERDKILFHKGFVFNLYQTDKDRVNAYQNEREKYEEYMQNLLNSQNKKKKKKHDSVLINQIDYTQSFSQDNKNNSFSLNNNNINNNQIYFKITQPEMRFKPRSDLERIYNVIENHQSNNFSNIDENKGKNIVKRHLRKMGFKEKIEEQGKSAEDIIEEKKFEIIEELINGPKKDDDKKKKKKERKKFDVISKMNNRRVDNSNAKSFYPDLYYKTYFNAVENYSLFKNSCFLPNNFENGLNNTNYNINKSENENKNKTIKKFIVQKIKNKKKKDNKTLKQYNINNNINKNKTPFSNLDLVNYFDNNNNNNYYQNDDNFIKSLDNIDLFTKGIKEKNYKLTKREQINFDIIKSMAFEKKKKKYIVPVYENQNEEKNDNKNNYNNNDHNSNIIDEDDEDVNEDYYAKKNEEKIKVDGVEYRKSDLENLSKAIMNKCKYTRQKFRSSDSDYSKSGHGKLMFTNGLTVEEFEKKYHIKG